MTPAPVPPDSRLPRPRKLPRRLICPAYNPRWLPQEIAEYYARTTSINP